MSEVHIVKGCTGLCDKETDWIAKCFQNIESAKSFVKTMGDFRSQVDHLGRIGEHLSYADLVRKGIFVPDENFYMIDGIYPVYIIHSMRLF